VADPKVRDRVQSEPDVEERVDHPRLWKVLLHNDDYTTQEFVVWVLETIFNKPHGEAFSIMMSVHRSGLGVAGIFTRDVADTKVRKTQQLAEEHEFPLLVTMEPEPENVNQ
jgi:ATP-dependent Clp protease adaptor protein ClpS